MVHAAIEKFFHDVSNDPVLHRALLKRSRSPADFYPQATKLARLLGYTFTVDELRAWADAERSVPCEQPLIDDKQRHAITPSAAAQGGAAQAPAAHPSTESAVGRSRSPWSLRSFSPGEPD